MEEKDLLLLEKKTEKAVEKREIITDSQVEKPVQVKNVFASTTFEPASKQESIQSEEKEKSDSSIIEKPNYDFIEELSPEEEQKIYKIEKEQAEDKPRKARKRLRMALLGLVLSVCSIWGIYNIVTITNLEAEIQAANEVYELNLANYLTKLGTMDTASSYNELFETFPEAHNPPASVEKSSNWFDRICDFIAGLFGG